MGGKCSNRSRREELVLIEGDLRVGLSFFLGGMGTLVALVGGLRVLHFLHWKSFELKLRPSFM
jgi:hypothetical protein